MGKIADTLAEAGHNVTILSPVVQESMRNKTYSRLVKDVVYIEVDQKIRDLAAQQEAGELGRYWTTDSSIRELIPTYQYFIKLLNTVHDNIYNKQHVLDQLKNRKIDVLIFEGFMFSAKAIRDYLQIPVFIPVASVTHDNKVAELLGEPVNPSYISGYFSNYGNDMTYLERVDNVIAYFMGQYFLQWPKLKDLSDPTKVVPLQEEYHLAPFHFINSNPLLDYSRPLIYKTVQIGGITVDLSRKEQVDKYWDTVLDKRKHTVLVSFGTMFLSKDMPMSYKTAISTAMKNMDNVTFIWKYEDDDTSFANNIPNIVFSKWVPQTALLADDRLTAFMTHAGLGSINEVSYLGKPSVICPLFADQLRNAKMLCRHNGSIEISKYDLENEQVVRSSLEKIVHDKMYKKNSELLAQRLHKQPVKPKELLVKYSEFAAEFGQLPSIDPTIRTMTFVQYHLIDIIILPLSLMIITLLIFRRLVYKSKVE